MTDPSECFIPFGEMPGFPNLFLDYVYEFENVASFYKNNFRNTETYPAIFSNMLGRKNSNQAAVANILLHQYANLLPSGKTQQNIGLLRKQNTLSVVTGQQLGILGGPLYTVYKIITAIKLAGELTNKYPEVNFVPVFWLEGEDHDFEEIRHVSISDETNACKRISYAMPEGFEEEKYSVGSVVITEEIDAFFHTMEGSLRKTDFTNDFLPDLKRFYAQGKTFKVAFKELLFRLFDAYGLVIFDPADPLAKKLVSSVYVKEIKEFRAHTAALIERSAELEEVYHAQVKVRPLNLFYHVDGKRYAIDPDEEGGFKLRKKRMKFSVDELLKDAEQNPSNFSPNVLLRPICQDALLNTAFYVGGPSEISYFAQVMPLYDFFDIPAPIIYPRASVTLLEKHLAVSLIKYKLTLQNLYLKQESLHELLLSNALPVSFSALFEKTEKEIISAIDSLRVSLSEIDKTTGDASERYKVKMISALGEYKNKALEAEKKKQEVMIRQAQKLLTAAYPEGELQERCYNVFSYVNKYGLEIIAKIYSEISLAEFSHQVITL